MMSPTKNRISSCWSVGTVAYASDCFKVLRQFHPGTLVMFDEQRLARGNQGSTSPLKNQWIGPNGPNDNEKHRKTKQFGSLYGEWEAFSKAACKRNLSEMIFLWVPQGRGFTRVDDFHWIAWVDWVQMPLWTSKMGKMSKEAFWDMCFFATFPFGSMNRQPSDITHLQILTANVQSSTSDSKCIPAIEKVMGQFRPQNHIHGLFFSTNRHILQEPNFKLSPMPTHHCLKKLKWAMGNTPKYTSKYTGLLVIFLYGFHEGL